MESQFDKRALYQQSTQMEGEWLERNVGWGGWEGSTCMKLTFHYMWEVYSGMDLEIDNSVTYYSQIDMDLEID
jgi:hypothetical protein